MEGNFDGTSLIAEQAIIGGINREWEQSVMWQMDKATRAAQQAQEQAAAAQTAMLVEATGIANAPLVDQLSQLATLVGLIAERVVALESTNTSPALTTAQQLPDGV